MPYCQYCGAEVAEGSAFCATCGGAVAQPEPQVVDVQPTYQEPVYQQPVYQQPVYQPPVLTGAAKILSIISMVCGLVSLASCMYGFIPGIAALILSNLAHKKAPGVYNKKADIGKTTGIIGIILGAICFVGYLIYCFALGFSMGSSYYY